MEDIMIEVQELISDTEWFNEYYQGVILNNTNAYAKELIMDYRWTSSSYLWSSYWWGKLPSHKAKLDVSGYLRKGEWKS